MVGQDLVAMAVNNPGCSSAESLFFDYFACGKLDVGSPQPPSSTASPKSTNWHNCTLISNETTEMPE